jgi:replication initiation protein RepC
VKVLRQLFKLNDRDITVLQAHLSVLPKGLLNAAALNMSYMKVQDILERANGM